MEFKFKQFSVRQQNTAMKVGTDSVLLGAWSSTDGTHFLDIGTGTGLLSLMLAQRNKITLIDAIEIDDNAVIDAQFNFDNSPWKNRLTIIQCSAQEFRTQKKYDLIICNPPFFSNSTKCKTLPKNTARHNDFLSLIDLINIVKKYMHQNGKFSLIYPYSDFSSLSEIAAENGLFISKKCLVYPNHLKNPKRVLIEFSFFKTNFEEEKLYIETEKRHQYLKSANDC